MRFSTAALPLLALLSKAAIVKGEDQWGVWFFSDGCSDTNGYSGVPGTKDKVLTCMTPETRDPDGKAVPGPYTNIVTSNVEELGMELILWNDTECREWITTIDTNGCQVVPQNNHIGGFNIGPK